MILALPAWAQDLTIGQLTGPVAYLWTWVLPSGVLAEIQALIGADPNAFRAEVNGAVASYNQQRSAWNRITNWLEDTTYASPAPADLETIHGAWSEALDEAEQTAQELQAAVRRTIPTTGLGVLPLIIPIVGLALLALAVIALGYKLIEQVSVAYLEYVKMQRTLAVWETRERARAPGEPMQPPPIGPYVTPDGASGGGAAGWGVASGLLLALAGLLVFTKLKGTSK